MGQQHSDSDIDMDSEDKKIGEVPQVKNLGGLEKIPVSNGGEPGYVEVGQIVGMAEEEMTQAFNGLKSGLKTELKTELVKELGKEATASSAGMLSATNKNRIDQMWEQFDTTRQTLNQIKEKLEGYPVMAAKDGKTYGFNNGELVVIADAGYAVLTDTATSAATLELTEPMKVAVDKEDLTEKKPDADASDAEKNTDESR